MGMKLLTVSAVTAAFIVTAAAETGSIITNVSASAVLNYSINSGTISAGSAAGVLLAATASESEFEEVTGLSFLDYFDNVKDAFNEFQEFGHPEVFSEYSFVTNYATNEFMNHWILPDGWTMDVPGGSNFWSSIPTDLRNTIIGEYHPPTNVAVSGSGLGVPSVDSWIFDAITQDVGDLSLWDSAPFDVWIVHYPVPNVGFLNLDGLYDYSLSEARDSFKQLLGLSSSSKSSFRPKMHIVSSDFRKRDSESSVDSIFNDGFRSSLESMIDSFFDKVDDFDALRGPIAGVCLAFYWIFVFVWFRRNSTPLIDGVMTLMWGAPPSSEPERDYDGYEL